MLNKIKYKLFGKFQNKKRLEQMKKNPFKRVDSQKMTDIEKMDKGFNGKTICIVEQFGFEIILLCLLSASGFTSETTSGTSFCILK